MAVAVARVGRTLLSDAFDVGVDPGVALAVDVEVARVGRTLLFDALDGGVGNEPLPQAGQSPFAQACQLSGTGQELY